MVQLEINKGDEDDEIDDGGDDRVHLVENQNKIKKAIKRFKEDETIILNI